MKKKSLVVGFVSLAMREAKERTNEVVDLYHQKLLSQRSTVNNVCVIRMSTVIYIYMFRDSLLRDLTAYKNCEE